MSRFHKDRCLGHDTLDGAAGVARVCNGRCLTGRCDGCVPVAEAIDCL